MVEIIDFIHHLIKFQLQYSAVHSLHGLGVLPGKKLQATGPVLFSFRDSVLFFRLFVCLFIRSLIKSLVRSQ